ncbi:PH domain-containing protein [Streptosporangium sp. NPDC049644]|uniref:PH domain-containing protein n=1 Tax=Streptosporangium sp. NPDC049644 TaxID=3155507 RepID=UPI0034359443
MPDTSYAASPEQTREPLVLRPPRHRIERRAILMWTLNALIWGILVVSGLGIAYALLPDTRPWLGPVLVIFAVIYAVNIAVMPTWRYLVHRWEITDQAVYALNGWITREWRITPISRIQSIDTRRGPLQTMLGLATLKVTTASREGAISIAGLNAAVAEEHSHRLTEITQATPGDAT